MTEIRFGRISPKSLMGLAFLYFLACGLSAIFWPESWYIVAGISPLSSNVPLGVTGAMLLALAVGAGMAYLDTKKAATILPILIAANALDLLVVVRALYVGELPIANSFLFIVIDATWCFLLIRCLRQK